MMSPVHAADLGSSPSVEGFADRRPCSIPGPFRQHAYRWRPLVIAVDFDRTLVEWAFPQIGAEVPLAVDTLKQCIAGGALVVLWTARTGEALAAAVEWCAQRGVVLYGVNRRPDDDGAGPKPHCDVIIDDAAIGCPLTPSGDGTSLVVDWSRIREPLLDAVERGRWL